MKITIDVIDLIGELRNVFPELDESKLKAAMFDLMLKIESKGIVAKEVSPAKQAAQKAQPKIEPSGVADNAEAETEEEAEEPEEDLSKYSAAVLGDATSWGEVGRTSVTAPPDASFGFEGDRGSGPELDDAPTRQVKMEAPNKRQKRGPAKQKEPKNKDPFAGMTDLEIARALTGQTEKKKTGPGGQFLEGGGEGESDLSFG